MCAAIFRTVVSLVLVSCVTVPLAACNPAKPQTLAEVVLGKEWTCTSSPEVSVTGAVYVTYFPNGERRTRIVADEVESNGDKLHAEGIIHGTYSVEGDNIRAIATSTENLLFTRNGVDQLSSAAERKRIEEALLTTRGSLYRLELWSANQMVWGGDTADKLVCKR